MQTTALDASFSRSGAGEPLVLVHGIGSRRQVWDRVLPGLIAHRDVIAVDLPGFGTSPGNGVRPSVEGLADAMAAFFRSNELDRPHVAGHSLGGAVALELGRRELARSAVAFAPIGFWGAVGTAWCQGLLRALRAASPRVRPVVPCLAKHAQAALPRARHVRLPGCGHVSMVDDPAACRLLLLDRW